MTHATEISPRPVFDLIVLDTDDPQGLGEFYAALLGWQVVDSQDDWVTVRGPSSPGLAMQLAVDHQRPTWPDNAVPQQFHLDLDVPDMVAAASWAETLGARRVPGEAHEGFLVMLDPSGHPFCFCKARPGPGHGDPDQP